MFAKVQHMCAKSAKPKMRSIDATLRQQNRETTCGHLKRLLKPGLPSSIFQVFGASRFLEHFMLLLAPL